MGQLEDGCIVGTANVLFGRWYYFLAQVVDLITGTDLDV